MKYIVYRTNNIVNEKIYVGVHAMEDPDVFDRYFGSGLILKHAIKKYGEESFNWKTLHVFENFEEAYKKEQEIVDKVFIERKDTYNLKVGGYGAASGEDHHYYGKCFSEEHCKRIGDSERGKHRSKETKKRMSESHIGKHHSEETKKKMSDAHRGEKNYSYGKHPSEETKKKMCESHKGKHPSEETRKKLSDANKGKKGYWLGKKHSKETCKKMSIAKSGKKHPMYGKCRSKEFKRKISESRGMTKEKIVARRSDIKEILKVRGWKTILAKKWGISLPGSYYFINQYTQDLLSRV